MIVSHCGEVISMVFSVSLLRVASVCDSGELEEVLAAHEFKRRSEAAGASTDPQRVLPLTPTSFLAYSASGSDCRTRSSRSVGLGWRMSPTTALDVRVQKEILELLFFSP